MQSDSITAQGNCGRALDVELFRFCRRGGSPTSPRLPSPTTDSPASPRLPSTSIRVQDQPWLTPPRRSGPRDCRHLPARGYLKDGQTSMQEAEMRTANASSSNRSSGDQSVGSDCCSFARQDRQGGELRSAGREAVLNATVSQGRWKRCSG